MSLYRWLVRRLKNDLVETHKILNNKFKIQPDSLFDRANNDIRSHQYKLNNMNFNTNICKNFFQTELLMHGINCLIKQYLAKVEHHSKRTEGHACGQSILMNQLTKIQSFIENERRVLSFSIFVNLC